MEKDLAEKRKGIQDFVCLRKNWTDTLSKLRSKISNRREKIGELDRKLESKKEKIASKEKKIESLKAEIKSQQMQMPFEQEKFRLKKENVERMKNSLLRELDSLEAKFRGADISEQIRILNSPPEKRRSHWTSGLTESRNL